MKQILIISDDQTNEPLRQALAEHGLQATIAENVEAGYRSLTENHFDLAVVNLTDPLAGVDLIQRIRSNAKLRKLHVLTVAEWGTGQATVALSHGSDGFEPKPLDSNRLIEAVENLLRPSMAMTAKASTSNGETDE